MTRFEMSDFDDHEAESNRVTSCKETARKFGVC